MKQTRFHGSFYSPFSSGGAGAASPLTLALLLLLPPLAALSNIPPPFSITRLPNGGVEVSWGPGQFLQTAPSVKGPWTTLANAISPYSIRTPDAAAFFRLVEGVPLTVVKSGTAAGTVNSVGEPGGIDCGGVCTRSYPPGTSVTLRGTPAAGAAFAGWTGDFTGTGDATVLLDKSKIVTATFNAVPVQTTNPIVNGDFEQGPAVGWAQEPGQLVFTAANLGGASPNSGQYATWLGYDRDGRRSARIGQRVTLPTTTPLFLNFAAWVYSEELCDVPYYDFVTIYLNGQIAYRDDRLCSSSNSGGWGRYSLELSALAGQSVAIVFEISSADNLATVVLLDDIAVDKQSWAP